MEKRIMKKVNMEKPMARLIKTRMYKWIRLQMKTHRDTA
jgi:hypothetical protein